MGVPKMDGLHWNIPLKLMMTGGTTILGNLHMCPIVQDDLIHIGALLIPLLSLPDTDLDLLESVRNKILTSIVA